MNDEGPIYIVKKTIWHSADECYYFPAVSGEPDVLVSLDHMSPEWRQRLVDRGVFEKQIVKQPSRTRESKSNDSNDGS